MLIEHMGFTWHEFEAKLQLAQKVKMAEQWLGDGLVQKASGEEEDKKKDKVEVKEKEQDKKEDQVILKGDKVMLEILDDYCISAATVERFKQLRDLPYGRERQRKLLCPSWIYIRCGYAMVPRPDAREAVAMAVANSQV
eukprot:s5285_g4.t1